MINLIPESSSAPPEARKRYNRRSVAISVLLFPLMLALIWLEASDARPVWLGAGVAAILLVLALFAYEFTRLMASLDELQYRIHVTALAVGFCSVALLVMSLGVVGAFFELGFIADDWPVLAVLVLPAGMIGYYIALKAFLRKYR